MKNTWLWIFFALFCASPAVHAEPIVCAADGDQIDSILDHYLEVYQGFQDAEASNASDRILRTYTMDKTDEQLRIADCLFEGLVAETAATNPQLERYQAILAKVDALFSKNPAAIADLGIFLQETWSNQYHLDIQGLDRKRAARGAEFGSMVGIGAGAIIALGAISTFLTLKNPKNLVTAPAKTARYLKWIRLQLPAFSALTGASGVAIASTVVPAHRAARAIGYVTAQGITATGWLSPNIPIPPAQFLKFGVANDRMENEDWEMMRTAIQDASVAVGGIAVAYLAFRVLKGLGLVAEGASAASGVGIVLGIVIGVVVDQVLDKGANGLLEWWRLTDLQNDVVNATRLAERALATGDRADIFDAMTKLARASENLAVFLSLPVWLIQDNYSQKEENIYAQYGATSPGLEKALADTRKEMRQKLEDYWSFISNEQSTFSLAGFVVRKNLRQLGEAQYNARVEQRYQADRMRGMLRTFETWARFNQIPQSQYQYAAPRTGGISLVDLELNLVNRSIVDATRRYHLRTFMAEEEQRELNTLKLWSGMGRAGVGEDPVMVLLRASAFTRSSLDRIVAHLSERLLTRAGEAKYRFMQIASSANARGLLTEPSVGDLGLGSPLSSPPASINSSNITVREGRK